MAQLIIRPLDDVMARFGKSLARLSAGNAHKVMARAMNYEGRKTFVLVKRVLRKQTSIPRPIIEKSTKFRQAGVRLGGNLEVAIEGRGRELSLKRFGARQFKAGVKATVWGKRQFYRGTFINAGTYNSGQPVAYGHVFHRLSPRSLPIQKVFGPSVPKEMVKGETERAFYSSAELIVNRVGKEIAAVLRGF